jgi:hypothetical protein
MRSEARDTLHLAYCDRLKALRRGDFDVAIFRMMGKDVPLHAIAHRLKITPTRLKTYTDRVFDAFPKPNDAVKPFPWEQRIAQ